jgi:hypothetical protein
MENQSRPIPIYTSSGEVGALLIYPWLYSRHGEWIGWVTNDRKVYSVLGIFVGELSNDQRILRKRSQEYSMTRRPPPSTPPRQITVPASFPLAPLMAELSYDTIDVLQDEPEQLHTTDTGELKPDLD